MHLKTILVLCLVAVAAASGTEKKPSLFKKALQTCTSAAEKMNQQYKAYEQNKQIKDQKKQERDQAREARERVSPKDVSFSKLIFLY